MTDHQKKPLPLAAITGGGGGLGRACAAVLRREGYHVILLDRDEARLTGAAEETGCETMILDVTEAEEVEQVFGQIGAGHGRLDLLVNNAGIAIRGATLESRVEDWNEVIAVNLTGSYLCARAAGRIMLRQGNGSVVNITSIMGLSGGLYANLAYQSSKGAIVNFTRALAAEWAGHGIRVNAVAPTWVDTGLIAPLKADPDFLAKVTAFTPMRCLADPDDVAEAVAFLASSRARMTTGHILPVDGGFLAI